MNQSEADLPLRLAIENTDDPRVVERQTHEDYAQHVVPASARLPKSKVFGSWWAIASAMVFLFYGALAAEIGGTIQALIGLLLAAATISVLTIPMVKSAIRSGLNSALFSRRLFGTRGSMLIVALVMLGGIYYTVFEGSILAVAFSQFVGAGPMWIWYAVVVLITAPLALGGLQTWMSRVSLIALPIYIVGLVAAVVIAAIRVDGSSEWLDYQGTGTGSNLPAWLVIWVMYVGVWVLIPDSIDFARFARPSDEKFHSNVTFGWAFYGFTYFVNGVVGIYLIRTVAPDSLLSEGGVVTALLDVLGAFGLVVIIVSQVRINLANLYVAGMNASRFWNEFSPLRISRRTGVLVSSLAVFLLMLTNVFSYISVALAWQSILIVGWVGVITTQMVFDRVRGTDQQEFRPGRVPRYGSGLIAWLASAAVGVALLEVPSVPAEVSGLAPVASLLVSVLVQVVSLVSTRRIGAPPADPIRAHISDPWAEFVRCESCEMHYVAIEMDISPTSQRAHCLACGTGNPAPRR